MGGGWPFESHADNLPGASTNYQPGLFPGPEDRQDQAGQQEQQRRPGRRMTTASTRRSPTTAASSPSSPTRPTFPGRWANPAAQVYVRDLKKDKTELISRLGGGDPASGGFSNGPLDLRQRASGRLRVRRDQPSGHALARRPGLPEAIESTGTTEIDQQDHGRKPGQRRQRGPRHLPERPLRRLRVRGHEPPWRAWRQRRPGLRSRPRGRSNPPGEPEQRRQTRRTTTPRKSQLSADRPLRGVRVPWRRTSPARSAPTYRQTYLRDRKQDKTTLISKNNGGDPAAGGYSENALGLGQRDASSSSSRRPPTSQAGPGPTA